MPVNKNADIRYKVLDRCFSDFNRYYTINDLLNEVNETLYDIIDTEISIRQLRSDIHNMRERLTYNAPIKAYHLRGKVCYYRYADPDFSIYNNEMSFEELKNLRATIDILGRYKGMRNNSWLEEVISKLEHRFGIKPKSENLISFQQNEQLKGIEFLSTIIDATVNHNPLNMQYVLYSGEEICSVFHPYFVKQYNNRWFVFGLDSGKSKIENKALDRIKNVTLSTDKFIPNDTIDFVHYFDDIVGVSVPRDNVKNQIIHLKFTTKRFPYVESKPIHISQKIIDRENCLISIEVKPTRELDQAILAFGPDVEVVSPQEYRDRIIEKVKGYISIYLSNK